MARSEPVLILSHGFSAAPFQWFEFIDYASVHYASLHIDNVLLGAHLNTYSSFKHSSWVDWFQPILNRYHYYLSLGYSSIYFGSISLSASILLYYYFSNYFDSFVSPEHLFLIDPFVKPRSPFFRYVSLLGPLIRHLNWGKNFTLYEKRYCYEHIPYQTLTSIRQFQNLFYSVIPTYSKSSFPISLFCSNNDPLVTSDDLSFLNPQFFNSDLHVFTRLYGRSSVSTDDISNQNAVFNSILDTIRLKSA